VAIRILGGLVAKVGLKRFARFLVSIPFVALTMNAIIAFCDLPNPRNIQDQDFWDLVNGPNFGNDSLWNIL
jgi:hypothetical protein